jgi:hypothetical protein
MIGYVNDVKIRRMGMYVGERKTRYLSPESFVKYVQVEKPNPKPKSLQPLRNTNLLNMPINSNHNSTPRRPSIRRHTQPRSSMENTIFLLSIVRLITLSDRINALIKRKSYRVRLWPPYSRDWSGRSGERRLRSVRRGELVDWVLGLRW